MDDTRRIVRVRAVESFLEVAHPVAVAVWSGDRLGTEEQFVTVGHAQPLRQAQSGELHLTVGRPASSVT